MAAASGLTLAAAAADLSSDHGSVVLPLQVIIQGAILSAQAPLPDDSSGVRVLKVAGTLKTGGRLLIARHHTCVKFRAVGVVGGANAL
jgi:hypothetical protein